MQIPIVDRFPCRSMDDASAYRLRHSSFVSGLNGTTQLEVFVANLVGPMSILLRNIAIPWIFVGFRFNTGRSLHFWWKVILDLLLVVLPITLSMTVLSDAIPMLLLLETLAVVSLGLFSMLEYVFIAREKPPLRQVINQIVDEHHTPTMFITYFRATVLISTGVAILAVDFPVFPRRFAKTETIGHSLMDVGTACFVFLAGVSRAFKRFHAHGGVRKGEGTRRYLPWPLSSSTGVLLVLGVGRAVLLKLFSYQEHVTEYGLHWNFFITLALIETIGRCLSLGAEFLWAVLFGGVYQYWLTSQDLQSWLLATSTPRDDVISANREGIYSLFGYLALYFTASLIGRLVANTGIRLKAWMWCAARLYVLSAALWIAQVIASIYFGPVSRRIANLPYVFAMLSFNTFGLASFLVVQLASLIGWAARMPHFSPDESPFERVRPCLLETVNRRGLVFFLLANLGTGLINLAFHTLDMSTIPATFAIIVFAFVLSILVHVKRDPP